MKRTVIACLVLMIGVTVMAQALQRSSGSNTLLRQMGGRSRGSAITQPPASQPSSANDGEPKSVGSSDLNFNQTPIDLVFETYSRMVKKTILKDPQVPNATITLKSEAGQKLTEAEQLEAIEVVLEMNGIHLEPYGESFIKALPRKDARKEGIPLIMDPDAKLGESGKVVSRWITFKNISTEEAQKALEGFKSNSGILLVFERTNSILVTDTEQNISRMLEISKAIDIASPVTEVVEYIQIKYANANEVKQVIDNIVQESMKEQEKNGKTPQNQASPSQPSSRPLLGGLRRPGQQQQQPAAPVNNASLVMTVSDADRGMIRGKVVTIADERSNKILIITNAQNMKFFKDVIKALDVETTPDTVVKVYRLKYAEAEDVSDMINDLIGNSSSSKSGGKANQNQNAKAGQSGSVTRGTQSAAKKPANQRSGDAKAGELNKDNTTVLADKRINGLVVMTDKELVPTIEQIIESMDIKLSQVLIETVIIEVSLGDDLQTGVDWLRTGDRRSSTSPESMKDSLGRQLYYPYKIEKYDEDGKPVYSTSIVDYNGTPQLENTEGVSTTEAKTLVTTVEDFGKNLWRGSHVETMLGGGGGNYSGLLNTLVSVGTNVAEETALLSPAGSGLNLFAKSDKLNLAAIIKASQSDNRSKYLASPIIMTLDNKEAQIDATEMRYLFKGYTYSGSTYNGTAVPDYEQKELGITIKITPKINPNGTVMLTIEEEYSQEGSGQAITAANGTDKIAAATTITRKMSADALLENGQTVIFAGLTQTVKGEKTGGIPILKDIPIIGKWMFGYVQQTESRNELLVFMTPHVLDDAQAAQAEALRRKKTLSDPRPWEDHGWSASHLADPVSKQEQMRRIKDEWKIQDEERKTKIAIEKMKIDRAKRLKEMSKDERDLWLKMHKEELDEEAQDELEEKMLDKDSQEELRKLAEQVKAKKLDEANKELKQAEKEAAAENERGRLEAEKKAKVEEESKKDVPAQEVKPEPAKPNGKSILGQLSEEAK